MSIWRRSGNFRKEKDGSVGLKVKTPNVFGPNGKSSAEQIRVIFRVNEGDMHLKRWITGMVALPILIYGIGFAPRWVFYGMLLSVAIVGQREFCRIVSPQLHWSIKWCGYGFAFVFFLQIYFGKTYLLPATVVFPAFVAMTLMVFFPSLRGGHSAGGAEKALFGSVYVCLPLGMLVIIYRYPNGFLWIFFLLTVIFASDTGAFYFGRLFGKHKLNESLSPNKTWEGAVGGLLLSMIVAIWFLRLMRLHEVTPPILGLVLGLSIVEQIGDLAESMLKRMHGVKDSGNFLPGHGGVLDRIDGMLFAIPVFYVYLYMFII